MMLSPTNMLDSGCPTLTQNGKRRGRKPGLNSTLAQRSAANARERSRMRVLSSAFVELKGALPWVPKDTKLSKLDTLKLAAGYIAYLKRLLDSAGDSQSAGGFSLGSGGFSCEQFLRLHSEASMGEDYDVIDFGSDENELACSSTPTQTPDSNSYSAASGCFLPAASQQLYGQPNALYEYSIPLHQTLAAQQRSHQILQKHEPPAPSQPQHHIVPSSVHTRFGEGQIWQPSSEFEAKDNTGSGSFSSMTIDNSMSFAQNSSSSSSSSNIDNCPSRVVST